MLTKYGGKLLVKWPPGKLTLRWRLEKQVRRRDTGETDSESCPVTGCIKTLGA
jgi:hypothetical protein